MPLVRNGNSDSFHQIRLLANMIYDAIPAKIDIFKNQRVRLKSDGSARTAAFADFFDFTFGFSSLIFLNILDAVSANVGPQPG